jgi:hypothetical protein
MAVWVVDINGCASACERLTRFFGCGHRWCPALRMTVVVVCAQDDGKEGVCGCWGAVCKLLIDLIVRLIYNLHVLSRKARGSERPTKRV